jgi:ATP-dependent 26S proteasome regulatory subunit
MPPSYRRSPRFRRGAPRVTLPAVGDLEIQQERAQNLWNSAERKVPPLARAAEFRVTAAVGPEQIGGLDAAQEEVLTYACAVTNPEVYRSWGTFPPSGLLLIGQAGCGKSLLAEALATRARSCFLLLAVPRLALEIVHRGAQVAELLEVWTQVLGELPATTVFFQELAFFQAEEIGGRRSDLPVGPILDVLAELTDRAVAQPRTLVIGSTSHPDALRPFFVAPGRFERVVEVTPLYPDDMVEALRIHAAAAEKRAGRTLFGAVDWKAVVGRLREPATGEWIHLMHAVLRKKARRECAGGEQGLVENADLLAEVEVLQRTRKRIPLAGAGGTYL